jgi:hypothetical protein
LIAGRQFLTSQVFHAHSAPQRTGSIHRWLDAKARAVELHTLTPAESRQADLSVPKNRLAGVGDGESKFWQVEIGTDTPGRVLLLSVLDAAGGSAPALERQAVRAAGRLIQFRDDGKVDVK